MSVCRIKRVFPALRLAAAGLLLSAAAVAAESSPPPPLVLAPATPPIILTSPVMPPPSADPQDVAVERQDLAAPVAEAVGVMDARQGGFPSTVWTGTSAVTMRALLPHIPLTNESPTLRALARRLLLTAAPPPKGAVDGDRPSLAELRVNRLLALGAVDGAVDLANAAPAALRSPGLTEARIQTLLLAGRMDAACAEIGGVGPGGELAKVQILCQLAAGNAAGTIGLDLQRERKPADTAFITAAEVVSGLPLAKGGIPSLREPSPVQLATLAAAKLPLPADAVETASPAALRAIAGAPTTPPDLRLAAAERAEALGVFDTDSLRKLVGATEFKSDELAKPDAVPGARGLALLARAAEAAADPAIQAALLSRGLDQATTRGRYPTAARLLAPLVLRVPAQPALLPFAAVAARALLVAGRADAATPWLDLASHDPDAAKATARLWPLARLHGVGDASPVAAAAWRQSVEPRRAVLAFALLSGLGQRQPDGEIASLLDARGGVAPAPAVSLLLDNAAHDQALGGTVLAALASLEAGGLDKTDPATLARVLAALKGVGLEPEARRLAVEILLANGM